MKYFFKYIFLIFCMFCFFNTGFAQKNRKKAQSTTSKKLVNAKKKKLAKTNSKKKIKKGEVRKKNNSSNSDVVDLSKLIQNANIVSPKLDTVPEKEVSIISAFKPQLKNIAKLNFTKSTSRSDSNIVTLTYQVPTQNLSFQYRPISLIPRSYKELEANAPMNKTNFKVGFGNYSQQLFDLSYHAVDANNNSHSIDANFESSNGMYYLQKYSHKNFSYIGDIKLSAEANILAQVFYQNTQRYRFGLVPDNSNLSLSSYLQPFSLFGTSFKWVNNNTSNKNSVWSPILKFEIFKGLPSTNNFLVEMYNPMSFKLKGTGKIHLDFNYTYNKYTYTNNVDQKNSIFTIQPSIELNKWNSMIKIGVKPTFTTQAFSLYPLIEFSKKLNDTNYLLVANWQTILTNNNYASLSMINPWLAAPTALKITTQEKKSLDLFINASKKLQYSFGLSLNDYRNIPFFNRVNNVSPSSFFGLQYQPVFEYRAITLEFISTLKYHFSDQLLVNGKAKYIQFNSIKENTNAWGILPLNLSSDLSWFPNKKWALNGEMQYWSGASFLNNVDKVYSLANTLVLNASFHYQLTQHLSAWAKAENLLDKKYQRWAEYPSLGVQLMAGIVYSFHK